ncbi:Histidinol-phosphate aminotransferase [Fusarium oxysporum f. sp. narcissi]|uniref:histidinol-phosphate transaminase n=1 Tax=Fusarium oxysporum f. sp. narcissi TaxID=451672 RepID=A0A4Q2W4A4_FUSOX|nr:Histidinol-phosphate aminotransferase [Fusarium oxysporum f. sp. cepae]RKK45291.1 Histidinol-phosphate aminotransferase [Fusarium oxysporum f. sp. cepae]RKL02800.1 Histidinol-phosphate aminotransferase [Fusarium oxysporum]RYC94450.1 Histidinol-phosphate aminotransferase [Fusarium oxysporum f. sp. narcissi]
MTPLRRRTQQPKSVHQEISHQQNGPLQPRKLCQAKHLGPPAISLRARACCPSPTLKQRLTFRSDYKDDGTNILLDANENAYGPSLSADVAGKTANGVEVDLLGLHRYPDPHQEPLKQQLCELRNTHAHTDKTLKPENLFVGVGSDEAIDALLRCFCVPGKDRILTCPPTYGMYSVSAQVNDVALVKVPLLEAPTFSIDVPAVMEALTKESNIKLVYLCSPGNPTGSVLAKSDVQQILDHPTWNGVVVLDEAYIDFAPEDASLAEWVTEFPNLVVMQTLSKAFGMAGIRLGAAFTSPPIARLLNSLKAPYNISSPTSALASYAVSEKGLAIMRDHRARLLEQRDRLIKELPNIPGVGRLRGGTESNFLLYEMLNTAGEPDNTVALAVYEKLAEGKGVVVRFRGKEHGCQGCLRITVGTDAEVTRFLESLKTTLAEVRGS